MVKIYPSVILRYNFSKALNKDLTRYSWSREFQKDLFSLNAKELGFSSMEEALRKGVNVFQANKIADALLFFSSNWKVIYRQRFLPQIACI